MMACRPRAMAPTASQVEICDASSKITTSKAGWPAGKYCATDSGDIRTQGASLPKVFGIAAKSERVDMLGRCNAS